MNPNTSHNVASFRLTGWSMEVVRYRHKQLISGSIRHWHSCISWIDGMVWYLAVHLQGYSSPSEQTTRAGKYSPARASARGFALVGGLYCHLSARGPLQKDYKTLVGIFVVLPEEAIFIDPQKLMVHLETSRTFCTVKRVLNFKQPLMFPGASLNRPYLKN